MSLGKQSILEECRHVVIQITIPLIVPPTELYIDYVITQQNCDCFNTNSIASLIHVFQLEP